MPTAFVLLLLLSSHCCCSGFVSLPLPLNFILEKSSCCCCRYGSCYRCIIFQFYCFSLGLFLCLSILCLIFYYRIGWQLLSSTTAPIVYRWQPQQHIISCYFLFTLQFFFAVCCCCCSFIFVAICMHNVKFAFNCATKCGKSTSRQTAAIYI